MFRKLKKFMREMGFNSLGRRKRSYAPSLSVSADCLEDRQLLTTGLGKEQLAPIAAARRPEVRSPLKSSLSTTTAESLVISQYESILLRTYGQRVEYLGARTSDRGDPQGRSSQ